MKLVHPDMEGQILLKPWEACEWIVESPLLFRKILQEMSNQAEGGEGGFVLSEGEKELPFSKNAEVVINPFALDINDKKILSKLYGELGKTAMGEEMYLKTQEMFEKFQRYFMDLEQYSDFMLEIDLGVDVTAWFKAFGIKLASYSDSFIENICQYIMIMAELFGKRLAVFVNIRSYLSEEQIEEVEKMAAYHEIALLFLENVQRDCSKKRKHYIIDVDGCEIF